MELTSSWLYSVSRFEVSYMTRQRDRVSVIEYKKGSLVCVYVSIIVI